MLDQNRLWSLARRESLGEGISRSDARRILWSSSTIESLMLFWMSWRPLGDVLRRCFFGIDTFLPTLPSRRSPCTWAGART
jgi:hypothetical protein